MPRIAAAADRAMIRRAVEIGDYHDAITNYCDLQFQLAESEESRHGSPPHTNTNPTAVDYKFVHPERIYSPEEHKELAQLYFWTHQDRPGFKTLLDGITLLGIDNDLGVRDPMIDCYLNNIMRADDNEIQRFYDLLGYAIAQARALRGDEHYLAFLCNARMIIGQAYGIIRAARDIDTVCQRIQRIRESLAKNMPPDFILGQKHLLPVSPRTGCGAGYSSDECGQPEPLILYADCEDSIMEADLLSKSGALVRAHACYQHALEKEQRCATPIYYDGTVAGDAASIGLSLTGCLLGQTNSTVKFMGGESLSPNHRRACLALLTYIRHTGDRTVPKDNVTQALRCLPSANASALAYYARAIREAFSQCDFDNMLALCTQRAKVCASVPAAIGKMWAAVLGAQGNTREAFAVLCAGLGYSASRPERIAYRTFCSLSWSWADKEGLTYQARAAVGSAIFDQLILRDFSSLGDALVWRRSVLPQQQELLISMDEHDISRASRIFDENFKLSLQPGHLFTKANILLACHLTNAACKTFMAACEARISILPLALPFAPMSACEHPLFETPFIEAALSGAPQDMIDQYASWLNERKMACERLQRPASANVIADRIRSLRTIHKGSSK
jgi:hypothetical protein